MACSSAGAPDSATPTADSFEHLVAEQTPGGVNEQVVRELTEAGVYTAMADSLDNVLARIEARAKPPKKKRPWAFVDDE